MIVLSYNDTEAYNHYNALRIHLEKRIDTVIKRGIEKSNKKIKPSPKLRSFLHQLKGPKLEQLITAKPSSYRTLITNIKTTLPTATNPESNDGKILYNIFINSTYENKVFDKLNFIRTINIDTCPYCNRSYIYALDKKNGRIKPQIDHFFPKTLYPFLGVSFYNLIPSCQTCNGFDAKQQNDPSHVGLRSPYLLKQDDFKFTFRVINTRFASAKLDGSSIDVQFAKFVKGNMNIFKLKDFYKLHCDHVAELIIKQKIKYPKSYRNELKKFGLSNDEIDRMILGTYAQTDEIHKRPLSKLYQDIGHELKLIN